MLNVIRAVVAAVVLVVVVVVALPRIFGPTVDGRSGVEAYLAAHQRGDAEAEARLTCSQGALPLYLPQLQSYSIVDVTTGPNGDNAEVVFKATQPTGTSTLEASVVREDGVWKWCGINMNGP